MILLFGIKALFTFIIYSFGKNSLYSVNLDFTLTVHIILVFFVFIFKTTRYLSV